MTEKRVQDALHNLDNVVSNVNLTRVEHAQLVSDLAVLQNICQEHFKPEEKKEAVKEDDDGGTH